MSATIIDGKAIAAAIRSELKTKIDQLTGRPPALSVVLVGDDPSSHAYVRMKRRACQEVGIRSEVLLFPSSIEESTLLSEIDRLNQSPEVDAILVQLPLPKHLSTSKVLFHVASEKDVDGFHPVNAGLLLIGDAQAKIPCTPLGVQELLMRSSFDPAGKHVVIVGRSNIVGKPLAALLMQKREGSNATVTVVHSQSEHLRSYTQQADILIAAMGQPHFITPSHVREGAVVIDVGISYQGKKMVGDVMFQEVKQKAAAITPVPGGVGPMTVAMLLKNTLQCYLENG
ncbi:MAG: bifunctional 5,10-methylenetetrahydrofolate dehydrogenase/5,10-methenyltetrahydrofolate cyclohydrolase [Verrucomicrobia bacterium]|nr:bifunctional 5,10-methylenetetrahydrofolate dehydrogenase/5,10-methenyltetrahydrofolate cyclohydrolase [Verrucomicrobiota bacterium]